MKTFFEPEIIVTRFDSEDILDASIYGNDVLIEGTDEWNLLFGDE